MRILFRSSQLPFRRGRDCRNLAAGMGAITSPGRLRRAGFDDIHFIDAMTEGLSDEQLAERMRAASTRCGRHDCDHAEHLCRPNVCWKLQHSPFRGAVRVTVWRHPCDLHVQAGAGAKPPISTVDRARRRARRFSRSNCSLRLLEDPLGPGRPTAWAIRGLGLSAMAIA